MKRLLSFLGATAICSSAVTALGLQYANKEQSSVMRKLQNYIDVSSLLARATILSQNPTRGSELTGGRGFSRNYASQYIDSRDIGDFFPNSESLRGAPRDTKSRILLGSMFNYPQDTNPFIPDLKDSNLSLNDPAVGKTGNDELINSMGLVSGVLQLLLGSDFNEGLASTVNGFLGSGTLDNLGYSLKDSIPSVANTYLRNPVTNAWIFDEFSNIWSEDDIVQAYPGKSFTSLTFSDVFTIRQNDFWKGIARVLYSGYGANWVSPDNAIMNATTSIDKAKAAYNTQNAEIKVEFNALTVEGLAYIIRYLRTLGVFYDSLMNGAMPINQIRRRDHLFSNEQLNGIWLADKIKNGLYAPSTNIVENSATEKQTVSIWSQENVNGQLKYYQLINLQSLVQFFMKLFMVDLKNDPNSYETQRVLAILLGVPLQVPTSPTDPPLKDPNIDNPFADTILAPLLGAIGDQLAKSIDVMGNNPTGVGDFLRQFFGFFRTLLADGTPMWNLYPVTNPASVKVKVAIFDFPIIVVTDTSLAFSNYLRSIADQLVTLSKNNLVPGDIRLLVGKIATAIFGFILQIEQEQGAVISDRLPYPEQNFGNPFRGLMSGNLLSKIYDLISNTQLIEIPAMIRNAIPNVNTVLVSPLQTLLSAFGFPPEQWPIYIYGLREKPISEIVSTIGDRFDTRRYTRLDQNQRYLLNSRALERLFLPLDDQVTINFINGIPPELQSLFSSNNTNAVVAALIIIGYRTDISSIVVDGVTANDAFLATLLGIQKNNDTTYTYREKSFFYALAQLYGHKNIPEDPKPLRFINKFSLQKLISNFSALIDWIRNVSVPEYVDTFFTPYFVNGWKTRRRSSFGLADPAVAAFIEYDLIYTLEKNVSITYRVRLERNAWNPNQGQPWFDYGIWRLHSINRMN